MNYFFISIFLFTFLYPSQKRDTNTTILDDIINIIDIKTDENSSDKSKVDILKEYFTNLKFKDDVDTKKYKYNIMSHNNNYILFGGYSPTNISQKYWNDGVEDLSRRYKRDNNEAQFQLSLKLLLFNDFLNTNADLFTAYTQNSYWQIYDTKHSSPFRETNYMPELFLQWNINKKLGDSKLLQTRLSFIHQSNGQDVGASRSWNRTEFYMLLEKSNYYYGFNIWERWDEDKKEDISKTNGDDNPSLIQKIGRQKIFIKYKRDKYNISLSHQNNFFKYDIKKGNTKLDIIFPSFSNNFNFFFRYFNGYGESLIDYDVKINRISLGMIITDWI